VPTGSSLAPRTTNRRPAWRDDLDTLVDPVLRYAQHLLEKRGAFHPFGADLSSTGEVRLDAPDDGDEHSDSNAVIRLLKVASKAKAQAGEIRASGICYNVRVRPSGGGGLADAVCVALEHRDGEAVSALLPYKIRRRLLGSKVSYGDLTAEPSDREVFV
jgi:hypothetical protein